MFGLVGVVGWVLAMNGLGDRVMRVFVVLVLLVSVVVVGSERVGAQVVDSTDFPIVFSGVELDGVASQSLFLASADGSELVRLSLPPCAGHVV